MSPSKNARQDFVDIGSASLTAPDAADHRVVSLFLQPSQAGAGPRLVRSDRLLVNWT